jgi:hypothetical protein
MIRQVELTKSGQVHWNIAPLKKNTDGIATKLSQGAYAERALIPASPWLGKSIPPAPLVKFSETKSGTEFSWTTEVSSRWWIVQTNEGTGWKLTAILPGSSSRFSSSTDPSRISIRACSATGILSPPVVFQK